MNHLSERIAALPPEKRILLELQLKNKQNGASNQPQRIPRRKEGEPLLLSFAQQRLWFLDQLEPDSFIYNMPAVMRLRGTLDVPALEKALNEIVQRHEALRTTFATVEGQLVQVISPPTFLALPLTDLRQLAEAERQTYTDRFITEEVQRPFNLAKGPLLRMALLRLDETEYIFLLVMSHIVSDGWSIGIFFRELSTLYEAFLAGKPSPLPPLSIQYPDFALWQRQWLHNPQAQLAYWKKQLEGAPAGLELPFDRPRPRVQTHRGAEERLILSRSKAEALKALSQQGKSTLFMTLLAAFKLLLYRYTGQTDILVGSPIAGRNWREVEGLIGFFINTLVLRDDLSGNPSFLELLERVRQTAVEAYAHQDLPFEKLVEELQPERDLSRPPLFQVFFNMLNFEAHQLQLPGLTIEDLTPSSSASKFDLTLYVREQRGEIHFQLVYNADLFCQARIVEMLAQFKQLLAQIVANPEASLDSFSLVTPGAKELLPDPSRSLARDWKGAVHTRFVTQAQRVPEQPAVIDKQGCWRYRDIDERSNQLAHYLRAHNVGSQDVVAIYGHRSAALVWALLGILKAGAAFVILDSAYPAARLSQYFHFTKPQAWLQMEAAGPLPAALEATVESWPWRARLKLPQSLLIPEANPLSSYSVSGPVPGVTVEPDDLAYILFTSGTTGRPNAIQGTHRPLSHFIEWHCRTFGLKESDRFSMLSGLSHDPLLRDIFTPLWLGAALYIPSPEELWSNSLADWINQSEISVMHLTPAMGQLITSGATSAENRSLRYLFFGGDRLTKQEVANFGRLAPAATCVNFYGATETPQAMAYYIVPKEVSLAGDSLGLKETIPLGQAVQDVQLLVLNSAQQLAGIGELGEIYIRTPYLSKGYLGDAALTQRRFIRNPLTQAPGDLIYKTGDLGRYLPDGKVEFLGRIDDQLKIRGFRIEPGEIEAALKQHPAIAEAVVIVRKDPPDHNSLVGYAVPKQGQAATPGELRHFLKEKLPDYMVPSAFVLLEKLPLIPNNKVDRQALPAPEQNGAGLEAVAPGNEVERCLSQLWGEVLGRPCVGIEDNFFALGGHSLLAVHLLTKIEQAFGVRLSLMSLFQGPTIKQVARLIGQQAEPTPWSSVVALQPQGDRPPFFCVHGVMGDILWFADLARHLAPDHPFYGIQARGLDGIQAPFEKIEAAAAYYIEEMRSIQPEGPYYLGGASYGGHVAFEMAQQLLAQGQQVALLALFDTLPPNLAPVVGRQKLNRRLNQTVKFVNNLPYWFRHFSRFDTEQRLSWAQRKVNRFAQKVKVRLRPSDLDLRQVKATDIASYARELPEYRHNLILTHYRARSNYVPKLYPGRITLFRAQARPLFNLRYPELEWRRLALGGVDVQEVPGSHIGMFREPEVQVLAQKLKQCIDKVARQNKAAPVNQKENRNP